MSHDTDYRATLTEGLIIGGLATIGLIAGQAPLTSLALGIGGSLAANLTERGLHYWQENWPTERGVLNQDIAEVLLTAFKKAVDQLEREWKQHPYYLHLRSINSAAAQQSLGPFLWLREDATRLFEQPECFTTALRTPNASIFLCQDEKYARHLVADVLENYLYGHDEMLIVFLKEQLVDEWIRQFDMVLHSSSEKGTRAWRNYQQLWQKSLESAINLLNQNTAQTLLVVHKLQEWAQRLDQQQYDATGEAALKEALYPVFARLDEMKANLRQIEHVKARYKAVRNINVNQGNQGMAQNEIKGGTFTFNFPDGKSKEK